MNRIKYDECTKQFELHQSTAPLGYVLDPIRYEHERLCRAQFGLVGGTAVSHTSDNLVSIENDLRGQTRPLTACPRYKYHPRRDGRMLSREYIKPVRHPVLDRNTTHHLPDCAMPCQQT